MGMGIYAIHNIVNGKTYIGSARNLQTREKAHFNKLNCGVHPSKHLQASYSKHEKGSFIYEVLENLEAEEDLIDREQYWIDLAKNQGHSLYNKRLIAESNLGWKQSKETIEKRKATNKARGFNYGKGVARTPESVLKIAKAKTGVTHPRKGDVYTLVCKYGHQRTKYANGKYRCKTCRRNDMRFYNTLNSYIRAGGY